MADECDPLVIDDAFKDTWNNSGSACGFTSAVSVIVSSGSHNDERTPDWIGNFCSFIKGCPATRRKSEGECESPIHGIASIERRAL
jgi:hypothetical protein